VLSRADGIGDVRWVGDDRLVVLAPRRPEDQVGVDDAELARRPRIIDDLSYRFNARGWIFDRPQQVSVIDEIGPEAELRDIGSPGVDHGSIEPSPDGRWVAVTGPADIIGSGELPDGIDDDALRLLLRDVFRAAGGTHDDYDEYDRVMASEGRAAMFVTPDRILGNA